jgi:hydrogenase expression/formation protein HypE
MGVNHEDAEDILDAISKTQYGREARIVGEVKKGEGIVIMETVVGGKRIVQEPIGSPIPRVC